MDKRIRTLIITLVVIASAYFAWKYVRDEHHPIPIQPSETWEPFVNSLDAQHETIFVEAEDGTMLEADLFIPNGGKEKKPAVVFTPGSGDSLYQNYAPGLIETYILDLFLERDIAVLLVNKRGMGQSEGNYVKNSIEGRASDLYAAVKMLQTYPQIDAENVGVAGHSQGGWVVTQAAAEHPDIAFFISLAGPTTTILENSSDNAYHSGRCQGKKGKKLDEYIAKRLKIVKQSISIGEMTNFGMFGFDARNMGYDPREAIQTVQNPGLFVYAENDDQVTPSLSIDRLNEIFNNDVPEYLNTVVIDKASHAFLLVNDPCESRVNVEEKMQSEQLSDVLNNWLTEIGY